MSQNNQPNFVNPVLPQAEPYFAKDFFVYEVDVSALAPATSSTGQFTVQADSDFLLSKLAVMADIAAVNQTASSRVIPLCTLLITDTGSGRNLMNQAVPIPNIFGQGDLPFILPRQRIFVARSVVTITVTNYDAAKTYNLRLSFIGEKGFRNS